MLARFSLLQPPLFFLVASCSLEPTSCDEAACNPASEYCVLYGSDTLAPNKSSCHELPDSCIDSATCDCLIAEEAQSQFCFDAGGCDESGEVIEVVCPGG